MPSRPGSRLIDGRYRLDRLLGRGAMGAVYAGVHVELERPTAIKLLLPALAGDPGAPQRFRREARAAARLNHPHVAGVHDFGTLPGGESYIIMELVEGETLSARLASAGALSLREAVLIARQVADGIESAHRGGVIHRDLKPSNIVVGRDHHGEPFVKVLDFGVAKLKEQTTGGLDGTRAGAIIGTPRYMSPEQCADHEVDARSDVYSLGVILYEMIAGRPPFDDPSPPALALKHIQEPPPPLEEARPDVPDSLSRLVKWALAKNPADRPQTAAALSRELRAVEERTGHAPPMPSERSPLKGVRGWVRDGEDLVDAPSPVPAPAAANAPPAFGESLSESSSGPRWRRRLRLALMAAAMFIVSAVGTVLILTRQDQSPPAARNTGGATPATPSPAPTEAAQDTANTQPSAEASPVLTPTPEKKDASRASEADRKALQSALDAWVAATNSRDVNRQLSYYAPRLEVFYLSRKVSRDAVLSEKKSTVGRAERVSITVGDPAVEFGRDGLTAVMTFRKKYVIDSGGKRRSGEVVQELRWARARTEKQEWRITGERDLQVVR